MAQAVKNLPAVRETQVWPLGWEDSLEKGMATHSSILAWRIPYLASDIRASVWPNIWPPESNQVNTELTDRNAESYLMGSPDAWFPNQEAGVVGWKEAQW